MDRVVIIGAGFGGLSAARALAHVPVDLTVVDRTNHHLFQPLLYQVATAELAATSITAPIRSVLHGNPRAHVVMGEVEAIDLERREVRTSEVTLPYDWLVMAAGSRTRYFGPPAWRQHLLGLKTIDEAREVRQRVLSAFEQAEWEMDPERRRALLTFVIVGAGPTGVEMAGALAELSRLMLSKDFRNIHQGDARIVLLEAGDRVLATFDPKLSARAEHDLRRLGVDVRTRTSLKDVESGSVRAGAEEIPTETVVFTAGVEAEGLGAWLGLPTDRVGRVPVEPDCSVPGHSEVFVIGDAAAFRDGTEVLPGVAPVAIQEGHFVARAIADDLKGRPRGVFRYRDKGTLATIGRSRAVAQIKRLRFGGFLAWVIWLAVHITYLIGFHARAVVLMEWAWAYFTFGRSARLINGPSADLQAAEDRRAPAPPEVRAPH